MASLNNVQLIGNLGADPEFRQTAGGVSVTTFRIAMGKRYKDKRTGEEKEKTEWATIVCWNKLAEIARDFLHKGKQVYVQGELQTRSWDSDDGSKRWVTEVVASEVLMLGRREDGSSAPPAGGSYPPSGDAPPDDLPF